MVSSGWMTNPSPVWQLGVWMTYHLFVQERARAQASYWICCCCRWHWPETPRDELRGRKRASDNLSLQCLDVSKIYGTQGAQSLPVVFWRPQFFLTCLYPLATRVYLLFKADHSLRSLLKLSLWSMGQTWISAHPIIWWAACFTEIFMVPRGWNPLTFLVACC